MPMLEPLLIGEIAACFVASLVASLLCGYVVLRRLKRWQVVDLPNVRSSHERPTPRGGGLGIVAVVLLGGAWDAWRSGGTMLWVVLAAAAVLGAVSFWDDRKSLPWTLRICVQAAGALVVAAMLAWPLAADRGVPLAVMAVAVIAFAIVGYSNAFNFMDGINGIAASQAAVTGLGTIAVAVAAGVKFAHPALVLAAIIAGAAAGFLPHNFPHARMFMGDVGAIFLGFGLAAIAVWIAADHGWWLLVPLGCLHANFILDTAITVIRRISREEVFHQAHREHFYQRLIRAGWSHTRVTLTEAALQIVVATVLALAVSQGKSAVLGTALAVIALWTLFFLFCEKTFRASQAGGINREARG